MTVLLVEQNARAALKIADRAYVMETGRIILSGSAQDLLADRQVTRAYLGRDYKEFTEGR
jgi:branched-chain amino acid transport system ATP-binding protein